MKRIVFVFIVMVSAVCYCQEPLGKSEQCDSILNKEACIIKEGCSGTPSTYTEIYMVVTDSIVYRFGLKFWSADSSFIKKVPMEPYSRRFYDQMQADKERAKRTQEQRRKETIEFINGYRSSPEVWLQFQILEALDK